ncbi:DUF5802 family protein [Halobium salinum]|uniref:DUF5802 family protein n=1 Tax=Halobium salinum TaxID=1364940 RepID=A0ABD5PA91_9EURY|nr:DUF5802 family protein [Halobium salinum]
MFERFSSGYYLGEMFVEPYDGAKAAIQRADHERMNEQLYTDGEGVERIDAPLVMKLDRTHFPVLGDDEVPAGTLLVPRDLDLEPRSLPDRRQVFLAKAERAYQLLRISGYEAPDAA